MGASRGVTRTAKQHPRLALPKNTLRVAVAAARSGARPATGMRASTGVPPFPPLLRFPRPAAARALSHESDAFGEKPGEWPQMPRLAPRGASFARRRTLLRTIESLIS